MPRDSVNRGGGIAVLFKSQLNLRIRPNPMNTTYFESVCIADNANRINLVAIYRPPPSPTNGFRTSDFLTEFDSYLDEVRVLPGKFLLVGDINIHWNKRDKPEVKEYINSITSANLTQHVTHPTHRLGNVLDHVLSCEDDNLVDNCVVRENALTWHHCVHFHLNMSKPMAKRVTQTLRNYKNIDNSAFAEALCTCLNPIPQAENVNDLLHWYDQTTTDLLNEQVPATTRTRIVRNRQPWYNDKVHVARQERHRAERKWRHTRLDSDHHDYAASVRNVNKSIIEAKRTYYAEKLADSNNKSVFQVVNSLLNNQANSLPAHDSAKNLADKFAQFFVSKIERIRKDLNDDSQRPCASKFPDSCAESCTPLAHFREVSQEEIRKLIIKSSNATCSLDIHPTWLVKHHLDHHLPVITQVVNLSLMDGIFPTAAHQAIIKPLLKKASLDKEELKNYRPVSNLSFIAKVIEKCVAAQLVEHMDSNNLNDPLQSAYRAQHCTETALMKVQDDIMAEMDARRVVFVVLRDMSAA